MVTIRLKKVDKELKKYLYINIKIKSLRLFKTKKLFKRVLEENLGIDKIKFKVVKTDPKCNLNYNFKFREKKIKYESFVGDKYGKRL